MTTATAVSAGPLEYLKTIGITTNQSGRGFINPYDCCFTGDGRILVLNHADAARAALIRIGILNWDEDYIGEFSKGTGRGEGQWMLPIGMAISADQRLHVTDEHLNRVTVFDTEGEFVRMWGEKGDGLGQLNGPAGISVAPDGTVYVVEQHNHRVQVFPRRRPGIPVGRIWRWPRAIQYALGGRFGRRRQRVRRRLAKRPHPEIHSRWRACGDIRLIRDR